METASCIELAGKLVDNDSPLNHDPAVVLSYTDPIEGFKGWLIIDSTKYSLGAGGMRVQKGLTEEHLKLMARNMTKKMRICGLPISGAKSGIDYDPDSPGKRDAMYRFIGAIRPFLQTCYSMGSDLNTTMDELNGIASAYGISTVKAAIANVQGFEPEYFLERCNILNKPAIGTWKLGKIRAGYVVAMSALRVLHHLNISHNRAVVAVQGFGVLARALIVGLLEAGVAIKAVADVEKCIVAKENKVLPIEKWLEQEGTKLPDVTSQEDYDVYGKDKICEIQCDALILAAIENAITVENAGVVNAKAIVPGANLAVTPCAERVLHKKGVIVLPCFVAGGGGTMSMNGLYGPKDHPTPRQVLDYLKTKTSELVDGILKKSQGEGVTPTQAANALVEQMIIPVRVRPYQV